VVALLLLGAPAAAQSIPTLDTRDLPGLPTLNPRQAAVAPVGGTVRLEVTPALPRYFRPIGDRRVVALASVIATPSGPVLLVPEFLVRDAEQIETVSDLGERRPVEVLRIDLALGLAQLALPSVEADRAPMILGPSSLVTRTDAVVVGATGGRELLPLQLGQRGEGALAYYRALSKAVPIGTPIIDQAGHLLAIAALVKADDQTGWAIDATSIALFLTPQAEP